MVYKPINIDRNSTITTLEVDEETHSETSGHAWWCRLCGGRVTAKWYQRTSVCQSCGATYKITDRFSRKIVADVSTGTVTHVHDWHLLPPYSSEYECSVCHKRVKRSDQNWPVPPEGECD